MRCGGAVLYRSQKLNCRSTTLLAVLLLGAANRYGKPCITKTVSTVHSMLQAIRDVRELWHFGSEISEGTLRV
jgi:hypothetical protein